MSKFIDNEATEDSEEEVIEEDEEPNEEDLDFLDDEDGSDEEVHKEKDRIEEPKQIPKPRKLLLIDDDEEEPAPKAIIQSIEKPKEKPIVVEDVPTEKKKANKSAVKSRSILGDDVVQDALKNGNSARVIDPTVKGKKEIDSKLKGLIKKVNDNVQEYKKNREKQIIDLIKYLQKYREDDL